MITFTYRWKIPQEFKEEFLENWVELTEQVRQKYAMYAATLYSCDDDFISITHWMNEKSWQDWVRELKNHPYRNRWRKYRVKGPDRLNLVSRIGNDMEGA